MVFTEVTASYKKPFHLFPYNKHKLPPMRERKGPIDYRAEPKVPVKTTIASRMRDKVIKDYMQSKKVPIQDIYSKHMDSDFLVTQEPEVIPRDNKTSQYRYKWAREIPVVSCRFTEHVMMYRKPPFTYERSTGDRCGGFRLRNMELKDSHHEESDQPEEASNELIPSFLM